MSVFPGRLLRFGVFSNEATTHNDYERSCTVHNFFRFIRTNRNVLPGRYVWCNRWSTSGAVYKTSGEDGAGKA